MIRYNTKEEKLEMNYEDICMTLHDCSDTLDCSTGYGGTYEAIVEYIDKLQNNWNELDKWLIEKLKEYQKSKYPGEYGLVLGFIWQMQRKMQELEQGKDE